jgi:aspartate kinase
MEESFLLVVMKFGGSSVGTVEALKSVVALVSGHSTANDIVVVVSAMNGVTNSLIQAANRASQRDEKHVGEVTEQLRTKHENVCTQVITRAEGLKQTVGQLNLELRELEKALTGISYLGELTPRSRDYVLSFGEKLSTLILTGFLLDSGVRARRLTGEEAGIVTDASFGEATPLMHLTQQRANETLRPLIEKHEIPVVTGYIAATQDGVPTTLGRGGSDYTATLIGSALGADEVWIWTDVDGMMTADPKIEPAAKTIREISFMEAMEMSHFGAKAMHPRALEPAAKTGLPVRVKNTFNPDGPDTLILLDQRIRSVNVVKAVTSVKEASMVTVTGEGMHGAPGTAAKALNALGKNGINVLMISQSSSEANISLVVARSDLERAVTALRETLLKESLFKEVTSEADVSIVAAVGAGMKGTPGIAARLFRAVADNGVNVKMIAQGSSELNISFVVREDDVLKSVHALHEEFRLRD